MKIFDKNTINNFAKPMDNEIIQKTFQSVSFILTNAIQDIKKRNPYLSEEIEILPVNEFLCGAVLPNSTIDVLLVISSPQLELNTQKIIKNKFKTFWQKLKFSWKISTKSKRKKEKYLSSLKNSEVDEKKYNMNAFNKDLLNSLCNYITPYSMALLENGKIIIKGEDVPFKVRVFPVINKFGSYNYYIPTKNKFYNIDFNKRNLVMENMNQNYGEAYISLIQVFNALYSNIFDTAPNIILIESLIANLPKETFEKESIYEKFLFAVNYLFNIPKQQLFSCIDLNRRLIDETLCSISTGELEKFFAEIRKYAK